MNIEVALSPEFLYSVPEFPGFSEVTRFGTYAAFARVVPVEHSPVEADVLVTIAQQGQAALTLLDGHPVILIEASVEGALTWVAVRAIRQWGGALVDVGDQAIRYYLPRFLRIPREHD